MMVSLTLYYALYCASSGRVTEATQASQAWPILHAKDLEVYGTVGGIYILGLFSVCL